MSHFQREHLRGVVADAHENFKLRFDYSQNGVAFLIGVKIVSTIELPNGKTTTREADIRAFGDMAEQLAHIQVGDEIEIKGAKDFRVVEDKNGGKNRYFPIVTVDEIVFA